MSSIIWHFLDSMLSFADHDLYNIAILCLHLHLQYTVMSARNN
jgi:hypothetical protein